MGGCISRCKGIGGGGAQQPQLERHSNNFARSSTSSAYTGPGVEAERTVVKVESSSLTSLDKFDEEAVDVPRDEYKVEKEKTPKIKKKKRTDSGLSTFSKNGRHVIEPPFQMAAFNVRRFGTTKMEIPDVVTILVKIIRKYDIIVIQEVVDTSEKAINALLEAVNESIDDEISYKYNLTLSPRVGRNVQKEQYAYFYRPDRVLIKETVVYPDPGDVFIREPYIVQFTTTAINQLDEFTIICIHTQPKSAAKEIDALADVHKWTLDNLDTENVVIMGDFNAGGTFVKSKEWETIRLRQGDEFRWLIPDHADTTATNTLAAYDRIVISGEALNESIIAGSAQVYRYDEEMVINDQLLLKVSDHYPVHVSLKPAIHPTLKKNIKSSQAIVVCDKRFPDTDFHNLTMEGILSKFKESQTYDSDGNIARVEIRSHKLTGVNSVVQTLEKIRTNVPGLLSYSLLSTVKYKLGGEEYGDENRSFWILIVADIASKTFTCSVQTNLEIA